MCGGSLADLTLISSSISCLLFKFPRYAGILSAYGMALADVVHEAQEPCAKNYEAESFDFIDQRIDELSKQCVEELVQQGFPR